MSAIRQSSTAGGARKVAIVFLLAVGLLVLAELALQVRSQLRDGQSVFSLLLKGNSYIDDPATGLRLLRPNSVFAGQRAILRANSLGLRSPEVSPVRQPGSWRIAVIGASTAMGLFDSDTEATFPSRLEQRLRREFPARTIEVVNAGIMGYGLDEQRRMLETRVAPLHPDLVIVYSGVNDFLSYCREESAKPAAFQPQGLPQIALPTWVSTVHKIRERTVFLRTAEARQPSMRDPHAVDLANYRAKLEALILRAKELGIPLLFSTNARAYHRDQPMEEQLRLSSSARSYFDCFDLEGMHVIYERHNAEIRSAAEAHGVPVIPMDELVPGGERYFVDDVHFTEEAEVLVGNALAGFIVSRKLLPE